MFLSLFFMKLYVCIKNVTHTTVLQELSQLSHCDHLTNGSGSDFPPHRFE